MANRYWVGGTASWDGTAGVKWSATSGGFGGASVPTTTDNVFFDANSGAVTVTIAAGNTGALSIDCTGFTGTLTGSADITVAGSITLVSGMTYSYAGTTTITGTGSLTTAGKNFLNITINTSGTVTLQDSLNLLNINSVLTLTQGTFDLNNFNVLVPRFSSSNINVRTVAIGVGTLTIYDSTSRTGVAVWDSGTATNLTITGTGTISLTANTSGGPKTFAGGSANFGLVTLNQGGSSVLTISGSNTFGDITNTYKATGATTITFTSGTTTTLYSFTASGGPGKVLTVNSTAPGSAATLSKAGGVVGVDYLSIRDSTATGGADWYAGANSTNVSNNTGWVFSAAPPVTGSFLMFF